MAANVAEKQRCFCGTDEGAVLCREAGGENRLQDVLRNEPNGGYEDFVEVDLSFQRCSLRNKFVHYRLHYNTRHPGQIWSVYERLVLTCIRAMRSSRTDNC